MSYAARPAPGLASAHGRARAACEGVLFAPGAGVDGRLVNRIPGRFREADG